MKRWNQLVLSAGILLATMGGVAAYAAEKTQVASDHQAMAASYEEKATAQQGLIDEHTQMKKDYRSKYYINEKLTPSRTLDPMNKHCDAIIKDATKLRDELREFAKWHKMRAAELEGK